MTKVLQAMAYMLLGAVIVWLSQPEVRAQLGLTPVIVMNNVSGSVIPVSSSNPLPVGLSATGSASTGGSLASASVNVANQFTARECPRNPISKKAPPLC